MARIELDGIAHSYDGRHWAVRDTTLAWRDGAATALLGPSGCGKTTMLSIVSGLLQPTRGRVRFDGVDVTGRPPQARNIAQVFQFPVVYDTMTVSENLAFPLRNRGRHGAEVDARVRDIAELLELTDVLDRRAVGLTADLRQRVSLGRGLVREDVTAVLLDEPLTVVDPTARWKLRRQLRMIHEALGVTLVYVTHDQEEALTLADDVLVMNDGEVLQTGTPAELFEDPAHAFVGYFIGSPGMNLIDAEVTNGDLRVFGFEIPSSAQMRAAAREASGPLQLGIRPEHLTLKTAGAPGTLPGSVSALEDRGSHWLATVRLQGGTDVRLRLSGPAGVHVGESIGVSAPEDLLRLFAAGDRIA